MFDEINVNYLSSSMLSLSDQRSGTVETFVPGLYPDVTEELNEFMRSVSKNDRLSNNYKNLDYFDYPFVSVTKRNNEIIATSTGYTTSLYPNNCIRILNRYYRNPNSRLFITKEYARPTELACVEQQLEMARRLNFDVAIITRDRAKRQFVKFTDALSSKGSQVWEVTNNKCLVTPSYNNPRAWQYIGYTKFKNLNYDFKKHWQTKD
jgi:hypothetical protein